MACRGTEQTYLAEYQGGTRFEFVDRIGDLPCPLNAPDTTLINVLRYCLML